MVGATAEAHAVAVELPALQRFFMLASVALHGASRSRSTSACSAGGSASIRPGMAS